MSTTIRKILAALLLCVALISLGLYLFNFVFEKHEIHDEARQESFVHDEVNNDVISNFFDWTQEDNDRDRAVRKIVLIVVGVSSASLGLVVLPKRRKDLTLTDTNSFLNMRPLIYSFKTIGVLRIPPDLAEDAYCSFYLKILAGSTSGTLARSFVVLRIHL